MRTSAAAATAFTRRPPLTVPRKFSRFRAMTIPVRSLEADHAFGHHPLELPAVLDVVLGVAEVALIHVLDLRENVRGDEPAAAELPAIRTEVARDAGQRAMRLVVTGAAEQLLVGQETVAGI